MKNNFQKCRDTRHRGTWTGVHSIWQLTVSGKLLSSAVSLFAWWDSLSWWFSCEIHFLVLTTRKLRDPLYKQFMPLNRIGNSLTILWMVDYCGPDWKWILSEIFSESFRKDSGRSPKFQKTPEDPQSSKRLGKIPEKTLKVPDDLKNMPKIKKIKQMNGLQGAPDRLAIEQRMPEGVTMSYRERTRLDWTTGWWVTKGWSTVDGLVFELSLVLVSCQRCEFTPEYS